MIGRRRPPAPVPAAWEDEGRRLAPQLGALSAAIVLGADSDAAAQVAVAAAQETARTRRTAIADLTGVARLRTLAGGEAAAPGITECFVREWSLNDAARPAADGTPNLYILPRGHEALTADVLGSPRWGRLAAGFAEADALLLIVAPADAEGLEALVRQTDGVVAVGRLEVPMAWRVVAQLGDDEVAAPETASVAPPRRARAWRVAAVVGLIALAGYGIARWPRGADFVRALVARVAGGGDSAAPPSPKGVTTDTPNAAGQAPANGTAGSAPTTRSGAPVPPAVARPVVQDTIAVSSPVNPPDSAIAAEFAVEILATNTSSGANLWVRERGARLSGVSVAPVAMGGANVRWYRVVAGAYRNSAEATAQLESLRRDGLLDAGAGRVVRTPLALLLESDVPRGSAAARVAALAARGVVAYALLQNDGTARLYAGAFETAAAAVPLDAELRAGGLAPQLAYRTGRTF